MAFLDFARNKGRSVAAIFVLTITIALVTGLFFMHGISNFVITQIENKIDITAYFKSGTAEQDILAVKDQILQSSPSIKSVQYVSEDQALANFTQIHKDNSVFMNSLTQVGDNPFLASLNITTNGNPSQYQQVATVLQSDTFATLVDSVDYSQKKDTIEKVFSISQSIDRFGLVVAALFILVVILVVFNTIKLAIENSKEEIATMRIVGASSWFVRLPFIIQGALFGCIAFIMCFVITVGLSWFFTAGLAMIMPGFNLFSYFLSNIWIIILIQLAFGVGLGVIASFIVVQRYLKV